MIHTIKSPPLLSYLDFNQPFILYVDASTEGLGCSLYQQTQGKLRVLGFGNRALSKAEKRYHTSKLEFLALKWAICNQFRDYLLCAPKVEVYIDNNPLLYVLSSAKLSVTGQRWVNEISSRFPENIHQYTSRAEQSSINAIFEGVQTQLENEEAWLCAINTSEAALEIDKSSPHKNNLQQVDIYHEQNQDHCINKVKDIIQSRV